MDAYGNVATAFNGNVTAQGALTGTLIQGGTAGELSFTGTPNAALSIFNGTGSSGTSLTLTLCPAEGCSICAVSN